MDERSRQTLIEDIRAEGRWLTALVRDLVVDWDHPSAAAGWSIRDQVAHIARFDAVAAAAMTDPDAFVADRDRDLARCSDIAELYTAVDRTLPSCVVAERLRQNEATLLHTLETIPWSTRVPWYGPEMSVASCATARMMEKFAHGQDIADAMGVVRESAPRLIHVAHLGVRTIGFSYLNRNLEPPTVPIRIELVETSSGAAHSWGPPEAADRISGSLLDFCLMVTRRRSVDDTALQVTGSTAEQWSRIAQVFAGAPGPSGRPHPKGQVS